MTIEYRESLGGVSGDGTSLVGLVTPFDTWTAIGDLKRGGFRERIRPGAFTKTLQERDAVLVNAHRTDQPMARTGVQGTGAWSGELTLTQDPAAGLRAVAYPIDASYARDQLAAAAAGVTRGMSFGFEVVKEAWTDESGAPSDEMRGTNRDVLEVRLFEVTTTAFPAYETTELAVRSRGTDDLLERRQAARAAIANYEDLHTCDCGATGQYEPYCTACGDSMYSGDGDMSGQFCGQCGAPVADLDADGRSAHQLAHRETRQGGTAPAETREDDGAGADHSDEDLILRIRATLAMRSIAE